MDFSEGDKKKHVAPKSGAKAAKKVKSKPQQGSNHKAFAIQKTVKATRMVQRTLDHQINKYHLPTNQRIVDIPPPLVVALVGPPRSGKSTLLRGLLKHFARQTINLVTGPITVVANKNMRFTFIECGCDINQMIDVSKIADIVLLLVNCRVGLEHYHFEFINLMQAHGMPRVVPVITHLDTYKDSAASRDRRRKLKHRLWTDLNAKIFLITRFIPKFGSTTGAGDYLLNEVRRLARLITVKVPRLTDWRVDHPYLLVDRVEDLTLPETVGADSNCDRTVCLYGWIRGATMPPHLTSPGIHVIGLGDFVLSEAVSQSDPCPLPRQLLDLKASASDSINPEEVAKIKKKRYLSERDRKIYAPMSSLSGVLLDKDATYIDLGGSHHLKASNNLKASSYLKQPGATQDALNAAQEALNSLETGIDEQLEGKASIKLFSNDAASLKDSDDESGCHSDSEEDDEEEEMDVDEVTQPQSVIKIMTDAEMEAEDEYFAGMLKPVGAPDPAVSHAKPVSQDTQQSLHFHMKKALDSFEFLISNNKRVNWNKLIYDDVTGPEDVNAGWNGDSALSFLSRVYFGKEKKLSEEDEEKSSSLEYSSWTKDWRTEEAREMIRNCFTAGEWSAKEDAATLLKADAMAREVLENAKMEETKKENLEALEAKKGKSTKLQGIEFEDREDEEYSEEDADEDISSGEDPDDDQILSLDEEGASGSDEEKEEDEEDEDPDAEFEKKLLRPTKRQKLLEKRKKHRLLFENLLDQAQGGSKMEGGQAATAEFDRMMSRHEAQMAKNREVLDSLPEETRLALEGHPPGSYVKLKLEGVPHEFITNFDPKKPLVVGGLARCEESMGYLHARFLTHRWSYRILKSNDPITLSVGWRRYQTVAVFSKEEHNLRKRYLKYSLKHEHCHMTFFGPLCPPKTGLIAFLNSAWRPNESDSQNFRVAGTGVVLDTNSSFMVMKKLKLVGEPSKIFAKTAFITGMFNSPLEVSKVIGAKIQTVSKIRGVIKASLKNEHNSKPGDFRATFEAPIKKADLVFLRSFVKVDLPQYYNPVMNLLCPLGAFAGDADTAEPGAWRMMRTTAELRRDMGGLKAENKFDSHYRKIERLPYVPKELQIPIKLAAQLPYKEKPKMSKFEYRKAIRSKIGHDPLLTNSDIPEVVVPLTVKMDLGENGARAPQLSVQEKATRQEMLSRLIEIHADFKARQKLAKKKRTSEFIKKKEEETQKLEQYRKLKRKEFFRKGGGKTPATKRQKVN